MFASMPEQMQIDDWLAALPPITEEQRLKNLAERKRYDSMSFGELMNDMHAKMAESLGKPGWEYRDLPRMSPELATELFDIIGPSEIQILTWADYGDSQRGQILVSPQGMENIRKHNELSKDD